MALIVFSTALLTLAVEVFYTRLFAALFWRNTAFAILSLAMLGIGASGVLVYLRPKWFPLERRDAQLAWLMSAFGASMVLSYLWVLYLSAGAFDAMQPLGAYLSLVGAGLLPFSSSAGSCCRSRSRTARSASPASTGWIWSALRSARWAPFPSCVR
jgi:hypothetical protein